MKEVNVTISINDEIIKEKGILENNIIRVNSNDEKIDFDLKNIVLTKQNKELKIVMDFKNNKAIYELVKENYKFSNNFDILSLTNEDKEYIINYQIEEQKFLLKINYETI